MKIRKAPEEDGYAKHSVVLRMLLSLDTNCSFQLIQTDFSQKVTLQILTATKRKRLQEYRLEQVKPHRGKDRKKIRGNVKLGIRDFSRT